MSMSIAPKRPITWNDNGYVSNQYSDLEELVETIDKNKFTTIWHITAEGVLSWGVTLTIHHGETTTHMPHPVMNILTDNNAELGMDGNPYDPNSYFSAPIFLRDDPFSFMHLNNVIRRATKHPGGLFFCIVPTTIEDPDSERDKMGYHDIKPAWYIIYLNDTAGD